MRIYNERRQKIRQMVKEGMTPLQVAKKFRVSKQLINYYLYFKLKGDS